MLVLGNAFVYPDWQDILHLMKRNLAMLHKVMVITSLYHIYQRRGAMTLNNFCWRLTSP